jgi:hypothetical protein
LNRVKIKSEYLVSQRGSFFSQLQHGEASDEEKLKAARSKQ